MVPSSAMVLVPTTVVSLLPDWAGPLALIPSHGPSVNEDDAPSYRVSRACPRMDKGKLPAEEGFSAKGSSCER